MINNVYKMNIQQLLGSFITSFARTQHYRTSKLVARLFLIENEKCQIHGSVASYSSCVKSQESELLTISKSNNTFVNNLSPSSLEDNTIKNEASVIPGLEKYNLGKFQVSTFPPTFNLAAYVNDSPTLQELVKLGVALYKWERKKGIAQFVLQLDFHRHMAPYIRFLHDVGVPDDKLGEFLTENPLIFKEDLDDLNVRINYLESKKFSPEMISTIISANPYWLMFSTKRIDRRLGHFQRTFKLSGHEVRQLTVNQPSIITYNMHHIKTNTFVLKEELGLQNDELKKLLLHRPRLWMINQLALKERFEYIHNEMKISHELIVKSPEVLGSRVFRVKERHLFLKSLKRDQYNPLKEGYVSLKSLVSGSNAEFAVNVAKTSVDTLNMFLKTL